MTIFAGLPASFLDKFTAGGDNECWTWDAGTVYENYGSYRLNQIHYLAHRFIYAMLVGPIPEGMVLDHTCHNADAACPGGRICNHRLCVNPKHLEITSIGDNRRRAPIAGMARVHADKTHCNRGHALVPENLMNMRNGGRVCKICAKLRRDANRKGKVVVKG